MNAPVWRRLLGSELCGVRAAMEARYPPRRVLPFARRDDCDDVACIVIHDDNRLTGSVIIVHDYASPEFEVAAEGGLILAKVLRQLADQVEGE